jgi:hypothetical protein
MPQCGCGIFFKLKNVGYVLYSLHVCVWAHQIRQLCLTIPRSSDMFVPSAPGSFLGGFQGGQVFPPPPLIMHSVRSNAPKFVFGRFLLFLADFVIFSGLLN